MVRPTTSITLLPRRISARPRSTAPPRLYFHSTTPARYSALFNLGGLAASREGQYLSRERGIPRTEYSSNIHLIRSSEVDPFAPAPGATRYANAAAAARQTESPTGSSSPHRTEGAANATPVESQPYILLKKPDGEKGTGLRGGEKLYILEAAGGGAGLKPTYRELTNAELTMVIKSLESKNKDHHAKIYFLLFTTVVLGLIELRRQWEGVSAPENQVRAAIALKPPVQEQEAVVQEAERLPLSAGKTLEQAAPTERQVSPQTPSKEQQQQSRGFLTSLLWSSRRGS